MSGGHQRELPEARARVVHRLVQGRDQALALGRGDLVRHEEAALGERVHPRDLNTRGERVADQNNLNCIEKYPNTIRDSSTST